MRSHTYVCTAMEKFLYTKQRAVFYAAKGLKGTAISKALSKEGLTYSPKSASLLIRKLKRGESVLRKPSTGRPSKVTQRVKDVIEEQMQKDDETTAAELDCILQREGIKLSRSTILRCHRKLEPSSSLLSANQRAKQAKKVILVYGKSEQ